MSAQLALCKGILHRKIVRTEIDEVFRYVELNPYSESLRELFFNKLLPNSTEEKNTGTLFNESSGDKCSAGCKV